MIASLRARVAADTPRLGDIFTDIHAHPELGFAETRTADVVARELVRLGFEVTTGIGGTGVVGILRNGPGPTVMYRADMDANAVEEAPGLPYRSSVRVVRADGVEVPVAHMCGHDAHVTWMLGMATVLAATNGGLGRHAGAGLPAGRGANRRRPRDGGRRPVLDPRRTRA